MILAPVEVRALSFLPSTVRNTLQSHAIDTWYSGLSMEHYRDMFSTTQGRDTALAAEPTNCSRLTLVCQQYPRTNICTIMATTDLLEIFRKIVPVSAIEKRNHCKMLRSLTGVFTEDQTPRQQVDAQTSGRHTTFKLQGWIKNEIRGWVQHQL